MAAAFVVCVGVIAAQSPQRTAVAKAPAPTQVPTFATMANAVLSQDYTATQLRRFRDENGNVVTVREHLVVDANGSLEPPFALDFVAVEGEPAGSPLSLEWANTYQSFASTFFRHGIFRIRDLAAASSNYALHDFGSVVRASRSARRMVVFPSAGGRPIWIVDVDLQTSLPLYVAEFDGQLRLQSEVEVVSFVASVQGFIPPATLLSVSVVPDFNAALALLTNPTGVVDPSLSTVPDFQVDSIEVRTDPLNGQQRLILNYTDGIDQFVIVQSPGAANPFDALPGQGSSTSAHTIARFRDPALSALIFWEGGVSFYLAGRGVTDRLDVVAKVLYLQALSS